MVEHRQVDAAQLPSYHPKTTKGKKRKSRIKIKAGKKSQKSSRHSVSVSKKVLNQCCRALVLAVGCCAAFSLSQQTEIKPMTVERRARLVPSRASPLSPVPSRRQVPEEIGHKNCAILLFGLPRAFRRLVLPSLKKHIIETNANKYNCDWFVHWYTDAREMPSRSGFGGEIDTYPVLKRALEQAILSTSEQPKASQPIIQFATDTNATFYAQHGELVERVLTEKGKRLFRKKHAVDPRLLYWPVKDKSYNAQTLVNVLKSWHSIQSAFELSAKSGKVYDRVAVLRSDVMFLTPIDVWARAPVGTNNTLGGQGNQRVDYDVQNRHTVVPGGFGMYPVNDRFICGPGKAVQVWATQRFSVLHDHIHKTILEKDPGFGMHNERFLYYSIFPRIQGLEYDMNLCLVRVRADSSVWVNDCGDVDHNLRVIEQVLLGGQTCRRPLEPLDPKVHTRVTQLLCDNVETTT